MTNALIFRMYSTSLLGLCITSAYNYLQKDVVKSTHLKGLLCKRCERER